MALVAAYDTTVATRGTTMEKRRKEDGEAGEEEEKGRRCRLPPPVQGNMKLIFYFFLARLSELSQNRKKKYFHLDKSSRMLQVHTLNCRCLIYIF